MESPVKKRKMLHSRFMVDYGIRGSLGGVAPSICCYSTGRVTLSLFPALTSGRRPDAVWPLHCVSYSCVSVHESVELKMLS